MRIDSIEIVRVRVAARPGVINSADRDHGLHKMVHGIDEAWTKQFDEVDKHLLVATCDDGSVGFGESLRGAREDVLEAICRRLLGTEVRSWAWQRLPVPAVREYDAAESLVLDLMGKALGVPASFLMGGALTDRIPVGAWSGHRTPGDAARIATSAQAAGFGCLKLKCDLRDDVVATAAAVADATSNGIRLIFDPNERFEELRHAVSIGRELDRLGNVLCLEDPLPRTDLGRYRELRAKVDVPIAVHVAMGYAEHGQRAADVRAADLADAADVFNISAGAATFLRLAHAADLQGRTYWHGSEIDLGILEATNVHAAASTAGCTLPSDIFGRFIRGHDLLRVPLAIADGHVHVPTGPGLGVELDMDAVDDHCSGRTLVR